MTEQTVNMRAAGQKRMKCGCLFHLTAYQPRLVYTVVQHCPNHARRGVA